MSRTLLLLTAFVILAGCVKLRQPSSATPGTSAPDNNIPGESGGQGNQVAAPADIISAPTPGRNPNGVSTSPSLRPGD